MKMNRPKPGFVVVGGEQDVAGEHAIVLMASMTLCDIELREQYNSLQSWGSAVRAEPDYRKTSLVIEMGDYVTVIAASYPEAWQKLFDAISPPAFQDETSQNMIKTHYTFNPPEPADPPWQRRQPVPGTQVGLSAAPTYGGGWIGGKHSWILPGLS